MGLLDIDIKDIPITSEYLIQNKYVSNGLGIYKKTVEICSKDLRGWGGMPVKYRMTTFNYEYNICTKNLMLRIPEIESWWYIKDVPTNRGWSTEYPNYDGRQLYALLHDSSTFPNGAWIARDCMMFQNIINEFDLKLVISSLEQLALDCNIVIENH
jgi:hypothetical protein